MERADKMARVAFHQVEKAAAFLDRAWRRAWLSVIGGAMDREASHWSAQTRSGIVTWQDHPVVIGHVNRRVSGDPRVNWLSFFARELGGEGFDYALNLGCGFGGLEAHAFSIGLVKRFHSIDVSEAAVASARERLGGRPVEFEISDINRITLQPETYDVVFASGSLHHFVELERVLDQVSLGLKPGGLFVLNEYVGPSRFQWKDDQLRVVNELLSALGPGFRRDLRRGFRTRRRIFRGPLDETSRDSPFEAARSEEIVALVAERFDIVLRRDYGGALLHPLLDGITGNFDPGREEHNALIGRLAALEEKLERAGVIGSDFTMIVARKR
jgi:SAM-dependent methyltransferase